MTANKKTMSPADTKKLVQEYTHALRICFKGEVTGYIMKNPKKIVRKNLPILFQHDFGI